MGNIAVDGTAGSGKSTVGEQLARQLGYLYVDTGAMYRAVTWLALHKNIDIHNGEALGPLAEGAKIVIESPAVNDGRQYTVYVNGRDVTWEIRDLPVTRSVSTVSAHREVRVPLTMQQRLLARSRNVVMVGRDIGSIVLPDADLKIFLNASLEERARRRYLELVALPGKQSLQAVLQDMRRRDELDKNNMQPASDAIHITTDALSVQQVLDAIYDAMRGKRALLSGKR